MFLTDPLTSKFESWKFSLKSKSAFILILPPVILFNKKLLNSEGFISTANFWISLIGIGSIKTVIFLNPVQILIKEKS